MGNSYTRKKHICPKCTKEIPEAFLEQNPFPEVPCPSCGNLVASMTIGSEEYAAADQREFPRCRASLKINYSSFSEFITEYTRNVSRGGMFINTKRHHEINETVDIQLHVPGIDQPLNIACEVIRVHIHNVPDDEAGIGVKFIDMDDQSRRALITYIKTLENCDG